MLDELRLDKFAFELEELDTFDFELALELDELNFELDELDFALEELELDIVLRELLDTPFEIAELL